MQRVEGLQRGTRRAGPAKLDLIYEAMRPLFKKEMPAIIPANSEAAIRARDRLRREVGHPRRDLGRRRRRGRCAQLLAQKNVPVILGSIQSAPGDDRAVRRDLCAARSVVRSRREVRVLDGQRLERASRARSTRRSRSRTACRRKARSRRSRSGPPRSSARRRRSGRSRRASWRTSSSRPAIRSICARRSLRCSSRAARCRTTIGTTGCTSSTKRGR